MAPLSLSEIQARTYWWCNRPGRGPKPSPRSEARALLCNIPLDTGPLAHVLYRLRTCRLTRTLRNQLWQMHDVPETDRRGFASGSEEARHESERRLSPCRGGDYHAASQCLCGARLDAGRTAGGEISAWAIPSAVGGGGPARRLGRDD